jgi:hypothetical protein
MRAAGAGGYRVSYDTDYYYERAEAELEMAQKARQPEAVKAHYTLAGYYLDRVYGGESQTERTGHSPK